MPKPVSGPEDVLPPHLNRHPIYKDFLFRDGFSPYPVTDPDASLKVCLANFGHYEYGILAVSTIIPAYFGYSGNRSFRSFPFLFGLSSGLLAGLCYAYAYSYCNNDWMELFTLIFYSKISRFHAQEPISFPTPELFNKLQGKRGEGGREGRGMSVQSITTE